MHVVVVGCGRVGSTVAHQLLEEGHEVVVIDRHQAALDRLGATFPGRTIVGVGFDRAVLELAGTTAASAVLAVTSGDNSNILIARVARETFGVERVVARIYDPRRAAVYERLGIPTVATVAWTAGRALHHVLPERSSPEWIDPTSRFVLVERRVPAGAAGRTVAELERAGNRIVLLTRAGSARIPSSDVAVQHGDLVHLVVPASADGDGPVAEPFGDGDGGVS